jgi:hypothetical protein
VPAGLKYQSLQMNHNRNVSGRLPRRNGRWWPALRRLVDALEAPRRIRDLLGLDPKTPEDAAEVERLREEETTRRIHEIFGITQRNSDEAATGIPESGSIKPNQTKSNQTDENPDTFR